MLIYIFHILIIFQRILIENDFNYLYEDQSFVPRFYNVSGFSVESELGVRNIF